MQILMLQQDISELEAGVRELAITKAATIAAAKRLAQFIGQKKTWDNDLSPVIDERRTEEDAKE